MKRRTKRVLGSCGLLMVAAMTAFAAILPAPGTSAVSSATDTIVLKVISGDPEVKINKILSNASEVESGDEVASSKIGLEIDYSAVSTAEIEVKYESFGGATRKETVFKRDANYNADTEIVYFDLYEMTGLEGEIVGSTKTEEQTIAKVVDVTSAAVAEAANYAVSEQAANTFRLATSEGSVPFGYGHYIFTLKGVGQNGVLANPSSVEIDYVPGFAEIDDNYVLHLTYDYDTEPEGSPLPPQGVKKVVVSIYDADWNLVTTIEKTDGSKEIPLPFKESEYSTKYFVRVAYYQRGQSDPITTPLTLEVSNVEVPATGTPDTGRFGGKLNISKTDYLITGLIVFGIIVVAGVVFVMKGSKQRTKRK